VAAQRFPFADSVAGVDSVWEQKKLEAAFIILAMMKRA
jgi:hypothetical protein